MWIFHKSLTWQNTHQRKVCASLCLFFLSLSLSHFYIFQYYPYLQEESECCTTCMESVITVVGSTLVIIRSTVNTPTVASGMFSMIRGMLLFFFILYICYHSWNSKATIKIERWYFFLSLLKPKNPWIKFLFYLNLLLYVIFIVK